jgi:hypothetical protein
MCNKGSENSTPEPRIEPETLAWQSDALPRSPIAGLYTPPPEWKFVLEFPLSIEIHFEVISRYLNIPGRSPVGRHCNTGSENSTPEPRMEPGTPRMAVRRSTMSP